MSEDVILKGAMKYNQFMHYMYSKKELLHSLYGTIEGELDDIEITVTHGIQTRHAAYVVFEVLFLSKKQYDVYKLRNPRSSENLLSFIDVYKNELMPMCEHESVYVVDM